MSKKTDSKKNAAKFLHSWFFLNKDLRRSQYAFFSQGTAQHIETKTLEKS